MAELAAKRYAQALFQVSMENNNYKDVDSEIQFIVNCMEENPKFGQLIKTPLVNSNDKKQIVEEVFKGRVSKEVLNFLFILIDKKRERAIEGIAREFKNMANELENIVETVAVTAVPMPAEAVAKLQNKLSAYLGKNVQVKNQVDDKVIGGVMVKMGDKVMDSTIKSRLEQIKQQLSQIII